MWSAAGETCSTLAPAARQASIAAGLRSVRRDDEGRRDLYVEQRAGSRHATARVDKDARRRVLRCEGDVARGERGLIGARGTRAHHDRLRIRAQLVRVGTRELAREPARGPVGGGNAAVDARCELRDDERTAGAAVMEIRRQLSRGPVGADPDHDVDPSRPQAREPRARDAGIGILERRDNARDPGLDQRVDARWRAAVVRARLERHEGGGTAGARPGLRERAGLGVGPTGRFGGTEADDLAVADERASDPGIRRGAPASGRRRAAAPGPSPRRRA